MRNIGHALVLGALVLAPARPGAKDAGNPYLGHINAVCAPGRDECRRVKEWLGALDRECKAAGRACAPGDALLRAVFGETYHPSFPDYVVYFQQSWAPGRRTFAQHDPVLMWKHESTPHLYGVRDVYAVVFTERRACLSAHATTTYRNDPNPLSAVLAALGSKPDAQAAKPAERTEGQFAWYPLSGDPDASELWLAIARFGVDENSTVRITVEYTQPRPKKASADSDKSKSDPPDECVIPEPDAKPGEAGSKGAAPRERYTGDFLATNGFFSNSPGGWATVAFGLGGSYSVRGTAVASGGSKVGLNGYAMAKLYLVRPRILASPEHSGTRRASLGVFAGTGVKSPFDELVFGLSIGHVVGNLGIVAGGNSIAAAKDSTSGRKMCGFAGIDYSF
jgi:hypothetical protein